MNGSNPSTVKQLNSQSLQKLTSSLSLDVYRSTRFHISEIGYLLGKSRKGFYCYSNPVPLVPPSTAQDLSHWAMRPIYGILERYKSLFRLILGTTP